MRVPVLRLCLALLSFLFLVPQPRSDALAAPVPFPDVPADATYAEAIRQLAAHGIVHGYSDGRFGPGDPLLRAQTAVILVRAMNIPTWGGAHDFADRGDTDDETWAAVRLLADRGIARGFPDGSFQPAGLLTRQQAISFISRALVALGQWQQQPTSALFGDVATDHAADVATYVHYVGAIPQVPGPDPMRAEGMGAKRPALRGWYAEAFWAALALLPQFRPLPPASPQPSGPVTPVPAVSPTPVAGSSPPPSSRPTPVPSSGLGTAPAGPSYLRGVNLCGAEFGGGNLPGVYDRDYTYPTPTELDYYRARGLTLVRLPVRWERLQHSLYATLDGGELGHLDAFVAAIAARNMQVIVEPHNYARYNDQLIGSAAVPNAAFTDFWRQLAEHYRGVGAIWAFGLMNEPHDTGGRWAVAAQAGVDGVRAADRQRLILVPGDGWSSAAGWQQNNANLWVADPGDNVMYEAHTYFDADNSGGYKSSYDADGAYPSIGADRLAPFVAWLRAHNARGFVGEYGVPDNDPRWLTVLDNFLVALDAAELGGTYWAGGPWWGDYPLSIEPRNGQDRPQMAVLTRHLAR